MDKPRIALIVDHPLRDLGGLCLVAWELARLGAEVYLVPFNWQTREVLALAPDLVVLNYLRPNNESFVDTLIAANIGYAMLDTEGGFYGDLAKYGQVMSRNSAHLRALRCMCVWGRKMYDYLAAHPDLTPAQLIITGLPRFDLYAPWLRDVTLGFLPREWRGPKALFLINTKISIANPQFLSREKEIETYVRVLGVPRADVDRHIALGERAMEQLCALAARLGARHPHAAVMIRPHPHERLQTYSDLLKNAPENVVVNREGGVTPWILRSSALIHRHCTTAVEAVLAGVPAIAPQWLSTSADVPDAEAISHRCDSMQELDALLNAAQRGDLPLPTGTAAILERIVDHWLFQIDGLSHKRAAAAILAVVPERRVVDPRRCRHLLYHVHNDKRSMAGRAYHLLNVLSAHTGATGPLWAIEAHRQQFWIQRGKSFSPDDVQKYLDLIGAASQGAGRFAAVAQRPVDEYADRYPGMSVKVSGAM